MVKQRIIGLVALLTIIGFMAFLFWFFSPEVLLAFIAGAAPSIVLLYLQNRKEKKEHHKWLLRNKEACLAEIVDIFIFLTDDQQSSDEQKNKILLQRIKRLRPALFVWGTPQVLRAWDELQEISSDDDSLENITRRGEKFFRTIRKALGHDDSSLNPGELWATLLKPEEKLIALDACKNEVYY